MELRSENSAQATKQRDVGDEPPEADTDLENDADILLEECCDTDNTQDSDPEPEEEEEENYRGVKVMLSRVYVVNCISLCGLQCKLNRLASSQRNAYTC